MKSSEIIDGIKVTDFENMFSVYVDKRNNYTYNLNSTLYINIEDDDLNEYVLNTDAYWTLISYKLYNTTRLAWLLMKVNGVENREILEKKKSGDVIKYPSKEIVKVILENISE